ncbi:MAG: alanine--tRNA ligase [Pelagibacteraceae bacterium]|nr:alanine--tRNA ligase [Pelagibacteraceae bacterium]OUV89185.1 MAG: alanine--tRNA ligase [Pelagibacteraceae bacterium TMED146]|tara:strand:- start:6070 stop:8748 length:2679 start_codon:yes stop_codon:yes gene_type:complete
MKKTLRDTRETFKNFFEKNGHKVISSSPLIPQNDPTLMFSNSGMVQFKNVFTGVEKRDYNRATTSQKCVRAGGKHNDLENVGYTPRHHTFFEMLGNFSFGDYFKEQAIVYAWELITKDFALPKNKLCVTVFSEDQEAYDLWKKIAGFSEDKIIKIHTSDNFWSMGETGPCGPCSEIFYDHGEHLFGGPPGSKYEDGDRFVEIWNLVFMQYEQISKDKRVNLPKPSVDTGMGLERMAAVLQGTHDNYQIDLFKKLVDLSAGITKTQINKDTISSHRVISDHLRASCFLIADGLMPSNEGRGYVLRRIMRRAMRHANTLGSKDHVLSKMIDHLIKEMSSEYNELDRAKDSIKETIINEEEKFQSMLTNGMKIIHDEKNKIKNNTLSGEVAFKLYDTYGFPLDLVEDYFKTLKIKVDTEKFNKLMEKRKKEARKSWKGSGSDSIDKIWFDLKDRYVSTEFVGYNSEKTEAKVNSIVNQDGEEILKAKEKDKIKIITNQTCFYAESGGQVGDSGIIKTETGIVEVEDTQKFFGSLFIHIGFVKEGYIEKNQDSYLEINLERRKNIKSNHSATHLLHAALREELGNHVAQRGSYVGPDRLRFDFSHSKQINSEQQKKINSRVNHFINKNDKVVTRLMSPEKAIKEGAMALFGEKYGEEVRVVSMGKNNDKIFSLELCGGIHVENTGKIGQFSIINESSIASGVRRIEALRGDELKTYLENKNISQQENLKKNKLKFEEIISQIKKLKGDYKNFSEYQNEKQINEAVNYLNKLRAKNVLDDKNKNIITSVSKNGIEIINQILIGLSSKDIRGLVDKGTKTKDNTIIFIISLEDQKTSIGVGISQNLTDRYDAANFAKKISIYLDGKGGGGRKDFAQAGGGPSTLEKVQESLNKISEEI